MAFAPIALFVFNRPSYTIKVLDALALNFESKDSDLYIYCDGPRTGNKHDVYKVNEVMEIIKKENRFRSVNIRISDKNKGLATSIITGVTEVILSHGKIIVLEDDILVGRGFLKYMNFTLDFFENDPNVASVNSYSFKIKNVPKYYFLLGSDCWGWGTWRDSWSLFNNDANYLLDELHRRQMIDEWEFGGMEEILRYAIANPKNVWHIKWHTSLFLNNKLGLWPNKSYSINIGTTGNGTNNDNAIKVKQFSYQSLNKEVDEYYLKNMEVACNNEIANVVKSFFLNKEHLQKRSRFQRLMLNGFSRGEKVVKNYFKMFFKLLVKNIK